MTADEVLAGLEKQAPRFVSALRQFMAEHQIVLFPAVQGADVGDQQQVVPKRRSGRQKRSGPKGE